MTDALVKGACAQASDTLYPRRLTRQEKPQPSLSFSNNLLAQPEPRGLSGSTMCTASLDGPCRHWHPAFVPSPQSLTYLVHSNILRLLATS